MPVPRPLARVAAAGAALMLGMLDGRRTSKPGDNGILHVEPAGATG